MQENLLNKMKLEDLLKIRPLHKIWKSKDTNAFLTFEGKNVRKATDFEVKVYKAHKKVIEEI